MYYLVRIFLTIIMMTVYLLLSRKHYSKEQRVYFILASLMLFIGLAVNIIRISNIIKLIIQILLFISVLIFVRNVNRPERKKLILSIVITYCIVFILTLIPIENCFFRFPSAQAAFEYKHNKKVFQVVEGDESTVFVYNRNATNTFDIFSKDDAGWKLSSEIQRRMKHLTLNRYSIITCNNEDAKDYFIFIKKMQLGESVYNTQVSDNRNSEYSYYIENTNVEDWYTVVYYSVVEKSNDAFELTINGETMIINP